MKRTLVDWYVDVWGHSGSDQIFWREQIYSREKTPKKVKEFVKQYLSKRKHKKELPTVVRITSDPVFVGSKDGKKSE